LWWAPEVKSWIILNIASGTRAGFHLKCALREMEINVSNVFLWAHTFWMLPLKGLRIPEFFFTAS